MLGLAQKVGVVGRPGSLSPVAWTGRGGEVVPAGAVPAGGGGEAGRSSGDDNSLVDVQRVIVTFVEKSVGAGRDEADPDEVGGGHGKIKESSSE